MDTGCIVALSYGKYEHTKFYLCRSNQIRIMQHWGVISVFANHENDTFLIFFYFNSAINNMMWFFIASNKIRKPGSNMYLNITILVAFEIKKKLNWKHSNR